MRPRPERPTADLRAEGMSAAERATVLELRWWTTAELLATTDLMFPETIPVLLPALLTATDNFTPVVIPYP